jgi:hypothetical protein
MARTAISALTVLCLGFTGAGTAWADESQDVWIEDPYQPHDATGAEVRIGSLVGILALDGQEYTGLGGAVAVGHRWDRLAIDAEYGYMTLTERGPSTYRFGVAHELGIDVRYDVIRLGPRIVGPNSMVGVYVEGRVARQIRDPDSIPGVAEGSERVRMPGGSSNQVAAGFGFVFDHRLEQPRGFPNRVGWQLGWRVVGTPRPAPDSFVSCRGSECVAERGSSHPMDVGVDETSLIVGSSLDFTW